MGGSNSKTNASTFDVSSSSTDYDDSRLASKQIELQLIEQQVNDLFKFKILLLGAGESGKSTVVKQLQLIHSKKKMQDKELSMIAQSLHSNVLDCMKALVHASNTFGYNVNYTDDDKRIISALFSHDENERITRELAAALQRLYSSDPMQQTFARRSEFWLLDSFPFCMANLNRFCESGFVPTEEDSVMARIRTTGIVVTELQHRIVQDQPGMYNIW